MITKDEIPQILFSNMKIVEPYPDGVSPISEMLETTAFFPGGKGLWLEDISLIYPEILVLGHDFATENSFNSIRARKKADLDCPTWKNIIDLFSEVGINPSNCFFSNVFMGLRKSNPMIGKFPGAKDRGFYNRNLEFLKFQIKTIRPKTIITLGSYAPKMLSKISDELKVWGENKSFLYFDKLNASLIKNAYIDDMKFNCIRLLHPSLRKVNLKYRIYKGYLGNEAEVMMLKEVVEPINFV